MSNWNTNQFVFEEKRALSDIRPLMRLVYLWMSFGLLTTAIVSGIVASSVEFVTVAADFWVVISISQIAMVIGLSWLLNKLSPAIAGLLFFAYSALTGVTFGVIFYALIADGQGAAISNAFLTTAGVFGAMTVVGYTTKVDLSKMGAFLMMALFGLIIAMIVNLFLGSSMLDLIISVIGVLVFTGLTAWDTQRIKEMSYQAEYQEHSDSFSKMAIMGALMLYLDFINLFIFLLRLFSSRD